MRGGVFHEDMIEKLASAFEARGLRTRRQVQTRKGGIATGYIDLLATSDDSEQVLLVEVEMSAKRALNDAKKRRDLGLGDKAVLWIVTPTGELARAIQRSLRSCGIDAREPIFVLPFGTAMAAVLEPNPPKFLVDEEQKRNRNKAERNAQFSGNPVEE